MDKWIKILQELEPITQTKKLHEQIYAMLRKAPDFTPDTADEFKDEQELLGKILIAQLDFQENPKYGHEGFGDMFGCYLEETEQLYDRAGQFFTPMNVVKMMAKMLVNPKEEEFQYHSDPAAGCGRFMLGVAESYHKEIGSYNFLFTNVDIDFRMYTYCTMNAILYGIPSVNILGDSLSLEYREAMLVFKPFGLPSQWHHLDKEAVQRFKPKLDPHGQQKLSDAKPVARIKFPNPAEKRDVKPTTLFDALK